MDRRTDLDPEKDTLAPPRSGVNADQHEHNQNAVNSVAPRGSIALVMAVSLAWSGGAAAEGVHLVWEAPTQCPGQSRFIQEVQARTTNASFLEPGADGRVFGVTIVHPQDRWEGTLRVTDADGAMSTREFDADACDELVSALALLTALAIDPNASSGPLGDLEVVPTPPPDLVPVIPPPVPQPLPPVSAPAPAKKAPWHLAAGVQTSMQGWIGPSTLPGIGVSGESWQERDGLFTPGFRLSLDVAWTRSDQARWQWYVARWRACPVRFGLGSRLTARGCAGIDTGAVHGEGTDIASPHTATRPWFAMAGEAGLLLGNDRFFGGVDLGLLVPVTRYQYYFDHPRIELHTTSAVGAIATVEAGVRIF